MTDGQRDWEIQLPEIATAYEVRVPLSGAPDTRMAVDMAGMTAADREISNEREAARRAEQGVAGDEGRTKKGKSGTNEGDDEDGDTGGPTRARAETGIAGKAAGRAAAAASKTSPPGAAERTPRAKASYLLTLARVKDLYRARKYELALVELVELEQQYPHDEPILSMKGSLYDRLGNKNLAREAWQEVLTLNPFNLAVLEALQRLGK
jgi:Flp pilus assembly protein TadD